MRKTTIFLFENWKDLLSRWPVVIERFVLVSLLLLAIDALARFQMQKVDAYTPYAITWTLLANTNIERVRFYMCVEI